MTKDILLVAHFFGDLGTSENNRFSYIANMLSKSQYNIEVVTSDFSHNTKKKKDILKESLNYKIKYIAEPSYLKNVSLNRFSSHFVMGRRLRKYLQSRKKPDLIYCAVPSLDVARVVTKYAKKHEIHLVLDIQDLWPEAFEMIFNVPILKKIFFLPMQMRANFIYKSADEIIAVSNTYVERAMRVNKKSNRPYCVYLGTELKTFDRLAEKNKIINKPENEFWLVYVGTLGHSYDLTCVIDAVSILKHQGIENIKFKVLGDGPLKHRFEAYAKEKKIAADFLGRLNYGAMTGILIECDIAVNPISPRAAQSIINKHGDYAAAGLPVLNTQESLEYKKLVDDYKMGINCNNNDPDDLAAKLKELYENDELRKVMGLNSRRLAEEKFDRAQTYPIILEAINKGG
ncbi:glycosyltransferase family 4 protein [Paenibacillus sp. FSL R7-0204]|uniref:glycosyltransferase family 4 protein n=1 Tax=Paenibacillus sp. FSL R7-0204 TaxID=2921675 RepID=UPI0030F99708